MGGLNGLILPLEGEASWPPGEHSFGSRYLFPGVESGWLTNHAAQAVIGAILVIGFWLWMARGQSIVPGKKQAVGEFVYDFVRNGIARDILGPEFRKYLPLLLTLFSFILVNNLFGQFFLFMFPTFSKIGFAWGLALVAWVVYNGAGIKKHGLFGYLKHATLPAGVPKFLWPLIIPLEFLSNIIVRPLTLGLRLFANLFAGHLVIVVFVVGGTLLLTATENLGGFPIPLLNVAGVVSILFSFAIFALELLVGSIQAYIFTVLTAQYVSSAIAEDH
ncbi:F0F1 ATP synthase subunit A [Propioniciclava sp. MC1595]|uniref:F0F1 ATP synthase subunit A n=1 Tax=unclassified Propioniciclava TaxID=2642922 RepID=UPI001600CA13|nr:MULTISPECIES: F0F1 ATP synthase subunit A [unclassified Propioniciclava]MBB1495291.1 F0F1 ATP synthase subunit A [Propioniciclava sp. MC1595]MBB1500763.1 F0F1 ATP synthase subunit A [Propioniciclava sp. MC1683]NLE16922.1 F0F1 ATP synthase subunit A [Propioniciclava sp.]QTE24755.1 F0F1 ATP synthase subunit A [Propioniciclava sp. MC1595]